jgi:uncharacterized protein (DUF2336 family)
MMNTPNHPTLDGLFDLACRDGVDIRPTLLRVLTDLYVQKPTHSTAQETQYIELALGLLDTVDEPTRAAVAASLSNYPAAPSAILQKLGGLSPPGPEILTPAEAKSDDLIEIFFAAAASERRQIIANLDAAGETPVRRPASASSEVVRRLEIAALRRNAGEFGRILERALGVSRALAERVVRDDSGEPIVVAAKALGMTTAVIQRILLFLNPAIGQSVERVHKLSRFFDELKPETAERMLSIWRKAGQPSRPVHESAYWDDERRRARPTSAPAPRRSTRDDLPARLKTTGR